MKDFFLSIVCSLVFFGDTVATAAEHSSVYVNEEIGIKVKLSENWDIYTTYDEAPRIFMEYFPKDKKKNDSPLFYARTQDQQLYARLLVDQTTLDLRDYFVLLAAHVEAESGEITAAKWVPDRNSIQWEYTPGKSNKARVRFS